MIISEMIFKRQLKTKKWDLLSQSLQLEEKNCGHGASTQKKEKSCAQKERNEPKNTFNPHLNTDLIHQYLNFCYLQAFWETFSALIDNLLSKLI